MNDQLRALEQDIGFLKALAEEGRPSTLVGGSILVAAGLTFGLASIAQWAGLAGVVPVSSEWYFPAVWAISLAAFFVELALILRRLRPQRMADATNRAIGSAWCGVGFTIFALFVCASIIATRTHSDAPAMMLPSVILAMYGLCWSVAASLTRTRWIWIAAVGSYAGAALVAAMSGDKSLYLVYAGALFCLATVPGYILMRKAQARA
jgi:hypothetical protein